MIAFYSFLLRKELAGKKSNARSGLFTAMGGPNIQVVRTFNKASIPAH